MFSAKDWKGVGLNLKEIIELLHQIFQQYGLLGLLIGFLVLGPGFTLLRTKTIRVQAEAKAQALVNEFARQERQRADRLEEQLRTTLQKLDSTEEEVSRLRLKLAETNSQLEEISGLRRQVRKLTRRVRELETTLEHKDVENRDLRQALKSRESEIRTNQSQIQELEQHHKAVTPVQYEND